MSGFTVLELKRLRRWLSEDDAGESAISGSLGYSNDGALSTGVVACAYEFFST